MWEQIHNLPYGMMNKVYGALLGKAIGEVIEIDVDKDGVGWGLVWVDITKPLLRDSLIQASNQPLWIPFKYECLPNFCFRCGIIKDNSSDRPHLVLNSKLHEKEQPQYGIWLRASVVKGSRKSSTFSSKKKNDSRSTSSGHHVNKEVSVEQNDNAVLKETNQVNNISHRDEVHKDNNFSIQISQGNYQGANFNHFQSNREDS